MNPDALSDFDARLLVRHFTHYMTVEQRRDLMREHPGVYNRMVGHLIVKVVSTEDGEPV